MSRSDRGDVPNFMGLISGELFCEMHVLFKTRSSWRSAGCVWDMKFPSVDTWCWWHLAMNVRPVYLQRHALTATCQAELVTLYHLRGLSLYDGSVHRYAMHMSQRYERQRWHLQRIDAAHFTEVLQHEAQTKWNLEYDEFERLCLEWWVRHLSANWLCSCQYSFSFSLPCLHETCHAGLILNQWWHGCKVFIICISNLHSINGDF